MVENNNYDGIEATEEECALAEQMASCLLKIWKLVGCFAVGFLLMMLGVTFMNYAVDAFFLGILCGGVGVVLMPLPSVLSTPVPTLRPKMLLVNSQFILVLARTP